MSKMTINFYNDIEVRTIWSEKESIWYFSLLDIISVLRNETDYNKNRNYWRYLKNKLKKENHQLGSHTTQMRLTAPDGKKRLSNVVTLNEAKELALNFPSSEAIKFIEWLSSNNDTVDNKSKNRAYSLFDNNIFNEIEVGTVNWLQQIHSFLFSGLYDFAGQIRDKNISKSGFRFAHASFLEDNLKMVKNMPQNTFDEIIDKYIEMNVCHPFMEGNGRSMRIWLDLILKNNIKLVVDWSKVDKKEYLSAMEESVVNTTKIKTILNNALTDKINDREMYMKGIDYSYYYEESKDTL